MRIKSKLKFSLFFILITSVLYFIFNLLSLKALGPNFNISFQFGFVAYRWFTFALPIIVILNFIVIDFFNATGGLKYLFSTRGIKYFFLAILKIIIIGVGAVIVLFSVFMIICTGGAGIIAFGPLIVVVVMTVIKLINKLSFGDYVEKKEEIIETKDSNKEEITKIEDNNKEEIALFNYIDQAMRSGLSPSLIRAKLKSVGWEDEEIERAYRIVNN